NDAARWQSEGHVLDKQVGAIGLTHFVSLDHDIAKTRPGWNVNLQILAPLFRLLLQHRLIGVNSRLPLGVASLGRHSNPFELALQSLLSLALGFLLTPQALLFLFQPGR